MHELSGKVAVVTGGASGIGLAMAERFIDERMRVVITDVEGPALEKAAAPLRERGGEVLTAVADVSDTESMRELAATVYDTFGAVHVLCNNAGVGSSGAGWMWEYEQSDWAWPLAVNVWGVINGMSAFLPRMIAAGQEGHVVNTSSNNGGVAPLASSATYAVTKSAVVTLTECLYAQLGEAGAQIGASVLFPGPNMLRTGLWESYRNRPAHYAKQRPRTAPYRSLDQWEEAMRQAGRPVTFTPVAEIADRVVTGIRERAFWILPESDHTDETIRGRAQSMLDRANPSYLERFVLD